MIGSQLKVNIDLDIVEYGLFYNLRARNCYEADHGDVPVFLNL